MYLQRKVIVLSLTLIQLITRPSNFTFLIVDYIVSTVKNRLKVKGSPITVEMTEGDFNFLVSVYLRGHDFDINCSKIIGKNKSRLDSGGVGVEKERFDIGTVCKTVLESAFQDG